MSQFRKMVEAKLTESQDLKEDFRIDNKTRDELRSLYKAIKATLDINDKAREGAHADDPMKTLAAIKGFLEDYNNAGEILINRILGNRGTDDLHRSISREIRKAIVKNPEIVSELDKYEDPQSFEDITSRISEPAKELLKLEKTLRYVRYIGAIRAYLGYDYTNMLNKKSIVGRYVVTVERLMQENPTALINWVKTEGELASANLGHALSALTHLGTDIFPSDRSAPVV